MVTGEYWWLIYLLFLAIPLARIIPRLASRTRMSGRDDGHARRPGAGGMWAGASDRGHHNRDDVGANPERAGRPETASGRQDATGDERPAFAEPRGRRDTPRDGPASKAEQTDEMIVLGAMHRGAKTFVSIQKKTGMETSSLNKALENLEGRQMIRVVTRKGLMGTKVEVYPTDKGFRSYYS